jgi:uncharacterized YigZ family protein
LGDVKETYTTLARAVQQEEIIKGSEFLAFAAPVDSSEAALQWVKQIRQNHPQATHVCWAYRVGSSYRFSDDGEPSGTAGAPMYRALEGSGLDHLAVAVVRYYGGTKLGAGGLVRAYSGAVAELLRNAPRLEVKPRLPIKIRVPFDLVSVLYHLLEPISVQDRTDDYLESGLQVSGLLLEEDLVALERTLQERTAGRGVLKLG